jgi:autotransporter-associated beta strand protein
MSRAESIKVRVAALLTAAVAAGTLADDAVWSKAAGGTYDWTNAANWVSGAVPNGAGQRAYLTNDLAGAQTVQLRQTVVLGSLFAGDAVASTLSGLTVGNKSGESFALTFDSGAPGAAERLVTGSTGTPTLLLALPVALASDLLVDVGGTDANNRPNLAFGGALTMNGHTLVLTNGVLGQTQVSFDTNGDIVDDGTLINISGVCLCVDGLKAFPGRLIANSRAPGNNANTFTFTAGGFTNAAEMTANGYLTNGLNQVGGTLHSGNRSAYVNNPGQRWTRRRITLNGGSLNEFAQTASTNGGNPTNDWQRGLEYVRSDVATVLAGNGFSYIGISGDLSTTTGTFFNVTALSRNPGATLYLNGPNTTSLVFVAANAASYLRGAGGGTGSPTASLVPWIGAFLSGNAGNPQTFATADATGSFRSVTDAEYTNSLTAGAGFNASVSSLALTSNATVNALRLDYVATPNIGAGRILTVASGGVMFRQGDRAVGQSGHAAAGTLAFGAAEAVVWVLGLNTNTIGSQITGAGGLTKTGTGVLVLTGANAYSGTNHVSGGTLRVGDGVNASNLGAGDVRVHVGAVLSVACAQAVSDSARLDIDCAGLFSGKVRLETGVSETVKYLYVGGAAMPSGTYGSSASAAAVKDDRFFQGEGVLVVAQDATRLSKGTMISVK